MTLIPVKTPSLVKKMFPNYVWNLSTNDKNMYLTFDDGPTPEITNWTLDILKKYNAKATFFCIGNNIEKHPEIFHDILVSGHTVGNHTYNHEKGWFTKNSTYIKSIIETEKVIQNQIQNSVTVNQQSNIVNLFRPPYGQITPKQAKKLIEHHYKVIMWDVLSFDWQTAVTQETCLKNVISRATNGSIVVFHDSVKASKNMQYALPKVLEHFSNKGFRFEALK